MPKNSNKESREMTTNLEQVCPNDPSHKLSPGTLLCMTCGVPPVPVGGVAAKPEHLHTQECWSGFAECDPPAPAPVDQPDALDTIDTLTRDACSVGYYGPKSVYRKRLNAYIARRVLEELEDMTRHTSGGGDWRRYINQRIAAIKKESQQ